jgi:sugar (pentulose or hexulose) kinase
MTGYSGLAIGLDMGTGGARAVAMDLDGRMVAEARSDFPADATKVRGACVEQAPRVWTAAAQAALRQLTERLPRSYEIVGIAVDATSGTFLLADQHRRPLRPALMYSDLRAADEAPEVADALDKDLAPYGIRVAPAFALPKLVHLTRHEPELFDRCRHVVHQTDWLVGMLCGRYDVTDVSTALKTGVDPGQLNWPESIEDRLGIPRDRLPSVVLPGTPVGRVTAQASQATGLPQGILVVAGCTDGTAGCLASGAKEPGDLNVTLGTTLVFKAISESPLHDPEGAVYNHRHPAGGYLPGAASSTGGDWIGTRLRDADLEQLGSLAAAGLPTGRIAYPLVKTGERFPFASATATGFGLQDIEDPVARFAVGMEATAFVERLGIERLTAMGLEVGPCVYATGGAVAGETWLRIRAAVNRRAYQVPLHPDCAVGAAVLAATPHLGGYRQAAAALVHAGRSVEPDPRLSDAYDDAYGRFVAELHKRGYLISPRSAPGEEPTAT